MTTPPKLLLIALGVGAVVVVFIALVGADDTDQLNVNTSMGNLISIQNIGKEAVTITNVRINERDDCQIAALTGAGRATPLQLRVGDAFLWASNCSIVRATITTANGSSSYTFGN